MEIFAAIAGLELLKQPCKVTISSDLKYVVDAMMEGWVAAWKRKGCWRTKTERPENVDSWQRMDALRQTHQVEFRWVKGHAGNRENERCDQLAMAALRQRNLPVDDGYENKPETDGVRPDMQEGEPCGKCSTLVIKRKGRRKPNRDYYYEFHLIVRTARRQTRLSPPNDSSSTRRRCYDWRQAGSAVPRSHESVCIRVHPWLTPPRQFLR